ncbi:MAG: hypothetical protein IT385_21270 [Deltaproteobacteria bacterium]|nr:hypothetical protein [Deltaproteobacteria bacterium]
MIDRLMTVTLVTLLALGACGKKAEPPAPTTTPATTAPKEEPPKVEPPKEEPPKEEPPKEEPPKEERPKEEPVAPEGVIPKALFDELTEQDGGTDFELSVDKALACANTKKGADDDCHPTDWYGVFAFHPDGRVAIVSTKNAGGCADGGERHGFYAKLPDLTPTDVVAMPWDMEDEDTQRVAFWRWLGKTAKDGFTIKGVDIRNAHTDVLAGIVGHTPLIRLGGALDKHWLYAHTKEGANESIITLVAPDNKTTWGLGRIAHVDMKCKKPAGDDDEPCANADMPGFDEAVPTPDGKALLVTASVTASMHCGPRYVSHILLPLPEALLPKAP